MINSLSCLELKMKGRKLFNLHLFAMAGQNSSRIRGWQLGEERLLLGGAIMIKNKSLSSYEITVAHYQNEAVTKKKVFSKCFICILEHIYRKTSKPNPYLP